MKRQVKRTLTAIVFVMALLSLFSTGFAAINWGNLSPASVNPRYNEVCSGKMYHEMAAHAWGSAYVNGDAYIYFGNAWQCTGCYYIMVTENDMLVSGEVPGKWAGEAAYGPLAPATYPTVHADDYGVCNTTSMNGYKFIKSNF